MAKVHVNPEEIDNFIGELERFLENLNTSTGSVNMAFQNLTTSWQDEKKDEFEEQFNELINYLRHFEENTNEKINHLRTLSDKAKEYLGV